MQEQEIIQYLQLLGEELEALQLKTPLRLLLIGGVYMITQVGNRASTRDIDVVVLAGPSSDEYRLFKSAVRSVARDRHISPAWMSDNMGEFISDTQKMVANTLWLKHGMLEIYLPAPGHILALKILAGREKDRADIQALLDRLNIRTRKQTENMLRIFLSKQLLEDYADDIDETLMRFFG